MKKSNPKADLRRAIADVDSCRGEIMAIEEMLQDQFPEEMERLEELRDQLPGLINVLKGACREYGESDEIDGLRFEVQKVTETVVPTAEIVEKAKERFELPILVELGFLVYEVDAKQIERLPGELQVIYKKFISKKTGTSRVTLPKELK